jgi:hypothetical protein
MGRRVLRMENGLTVTVGHDDPSRSCFAQIAGQVEDEGRQLPYRPHQEPSIEDVLPKCGLQFVST